MTDILILRTITYLLCLVFLYTIHLRFAFFFQERRKELMKKTAASYTADSGTLKNLRPLRIISNTKEAKVEVTQTTCIVTDVPDVENGRTSNQTTLVERVCECFRYVKTECETCLSRIPLLMSIRKRMRTVAECAAFDAVIMGVIMLNTIVLALYHHGIEKKFEKVLDLCNMV